MFLLMFNQIKKLENNRKSLCIPLNNMYCMESNEVHAKKASK